MDSGNEVNATKIAKRESNWYSHSATVSLRSVNGFGYPRPTLYKRLAKPLSDKVKYTWWSWDDYSIGSIPAQRSRPQVLTSSISTYLT